MSGNSKSVVLVFITHKNPSNGLIEYEYPGDKIEIQKKKIDCNIDLLDEDVINFQEILRKEQKVTIHIFQRHKKTESFVYYGHSDSVNLKESKLQVNISRHRQTIFVPRQKHKVPWFRYKKDCMTFLGETKHCNLNRGVVWL